jgi:diadenosine tetraphosphate (Ap4A) HIT family hydrolase
VEPVRGCLACELTSGSRDVPGGRIHETGRWVVEHCVGPLGVGTLIVKPLRHVTHVWELDEEEASDLGPLLRRVARAIEQLLAPEQLYVSLWSHSGGVPVHIHWVLQPVGAERPGGLIGPHLQAAMFDRGEEPPRDEVEQLAARMRALLS